jgi:hypothetical protein
MVSRLTWSEEPWAVTIDSQSEEMQTRRQRFDTREFTASVFPLFFGSSYLGHLFFQRDNMRFSILRAFLLRGLCSADFTLRVWCTRGGLRACRPYLYSKFLTVESVYRYSASFLRRSVLQAADLVSQCRHLAKQCGKDISGCIIRIHFLGDRLQKRGL